MVKYGLLGLGFFVGCGNASAPGPAGGGPPSAPTYYALERLQDPETCAECHPKQYEDWSGSMHAYASDDPVFIALNERGQKEANIGNFCIKCHAPLALADADAERVIDRAMLAALPKRQRGITCYFCHAVDAVEGAHNNPLRLASDGVMRGQFDDPVPNEAHASAYSALHDNDRLASSDLCGSCHDFVNGKNVHLERTYQEWKDSVYNNQEGGTTCGKCHMRTSANQAIAQGSKVTGVLLRSTHGHDFPGVDVALTPWPKVDEQRAAIEDLLDNRTLQTALCVSGLLEGAPSVLTIIDNVGAGHKWPSGASQDRRAWVEVTAYSGGAKIYESGAVPAGTEPSHLVDDDFWLIRDCTFDDNGKETHKFWEVHSVDSNLLPVLATFDRTQGAFYQVHQTQRFPRNTGTRLSANPDRVTLRIWLQAIPLDLFDELFANPEEQGLTKEQVENMREKLAPFQVGETLEWTSDVIARGPSYWGSDLSRLPVYCVSRNDRFNFGAQKTPAPRHVTCKP
jgi:hypothetical protein